MTCLSISLDDLHRLMNVAPDLPMKQVYQLAAWIAELRAESTLHVGADFASSPDTTVIRFWAPDEDPAEDTISITKVPIDRASQEVQSPDIQAHEPDHEAAPEPAPEPAPVPAPKTEPKSILKPVANHARPFTDAEDLRIFDMKNAGKTVAEISEVLGRTEASINYRWYKRLKGADVEMLRKRVAPPKSTPQPGEAARLTARQRSFAAELMRLGDDFAPEDDLYLAREMAEGTAAAVVADQLGCEPADVARRWQRMVAIEEFAPLSAGKKDTGHSDLIAALAFLAVQPA